MSDSKFYGNRKILDVAGSWDLLIYNSQFNGHPTNRDTCISLYDMSSSILRIKNDCRFNDYDYCLRVDDHNAAKLSIPKVLSTTIDGAKFTNSINTIRVKNITSAFYITNCEFTDGSTAIWCDKSPLKMVNNDVKMFQSGIYINNPGIVEVTDNDILLNDSYVSSLGIEVSNNMRNSKVTLNHNKVYYYKGRATYGSGISINNPFVLNNSNTVVKNNDMIASGNVLIGWANNHVGLIQPSTACGITNSIGTRILDNSINLNSFQSGIKAVASDVLNISRNTITGNSIADSEGILLTATPRSLIKCNKTTSTRLGLKSDESNGMSNVKNNTFGYGNETVTTHAVGLDVNEFSYLGIQDLSLNKWPTKYGTIGARNLNTIGDLYYQQTRFIVHTPLGTIYHPSNTGAPFFDAPVIITINDENVCQVVDVNEIANPNVELQNLLQMISGSQATTPVMLMTNYEAQRVAFRHLAEGSSALTANPSLFTFYNMQLLGNIGKFYNIEKNWNNKALVQPYSVAFLDSIQVQLDSLSESDSCIQNALILSNLTEQASQATIANNNFYSSLTDQELADLGQIIPDNAIEQNMKKLYQIYFSTIAKDNLALTGTQMNELVEIANMCPLLAGPLVHVARAMRKYITNEDYEYVDTCSTVAQRGTDGTTHKFFVSPNPANSQITVNFEKTDADRTVEILSSEGVRIFQFDAGRSNFVAIDVSTLPNGFYFVRLQENNQVTNVEKIVIIR